MGASWCTAAPAWVYALACETRHTRAPRDDEDEEEERARVAAARAAFDEEAWRAIKWE